MKNSKGSALLFCVAIKKLQNQNLVRLLILEPIPFLSFGLFSTEVVYIRKIRPVNTRPLQAILKNTLLVDTAWITHGEWIPSHGLQRSPDTVYSIAPTLVSSILWNLVLGSNNVFGLEPYITAATLRNDISDSNKAAYHNARSTRYNDSIFGEWVLPG
jgi:hypothetical protein